MLICHMKFLKMMVAVVIMIPEAVAAFIPRRLVKSCVKKASEPATSTAVRLAALQGLIATSISAFLVIDSCIPIKPYPTSASHGLREE